ncbi:hypothetical protein DERP_010416 [Dermatophagoides pteronyssinus]|uniref:Uncharacterized protein n=1 Tax=Dermatophagoides pteronyssinus TaxID=6956 RepID=A0ABQ8J515_DERPT|nr:hypothetical protein DERP_010416 [Dermatophagoides pteronyssinus]
MDIQTYVPNGRKITPFTLIGSESSVIYVILDVLISSEILYLHKDQMVAYNISGNLYRIAIKIQTFHNEQFNAKN